MSRFIEVVGYQEEWRLRYEKEAELLRSVFGKALVAIHHVGSTSIFGMRAKPVIDILIEIRSKITTVPLTCDRSLVRQINIVGCENK